MNHELRMKALCSHLVLIVAGEVHLLDVGAESLELIDYILVASLDILRWCR